MRVNNALDDAAGIAISGRMTSQIRGYSAAARNVNDGVSMVQTAEGALSNISDNLQRIRELAVQAANATNSESDRAALQQEVASRLQEIDRIANTTKFNGIKLLDGSFSSLAFQVDCSTGTSSQVSIDSLLNTQTAHLGTLSAYSAQTITNVAIGWGAPGDLVINGLPMPARVPDGVSTWNAANSAQTVINAINALTEQTGVTAETTYPAQLDFTPTAAGGAFSFKVNGVTISGTTGADAMAAVNTIVDAVNAKTASSGVRASSYLNGTRFMVQVIDGRNLEVAPIVTGGSGIVGNWMTWGNGVTFSSSDPAGFTLSGPRAVTFLGADKTFVPTVTQTAGASTMDVSTSSTAEDALDTADRAIQEVAAARARLGAMQSRFESAADSLAIAGENLSEARSRILDADYAQETTSLMRAKILQQAGMAMVVQANAQPQNVLVLLKSLTIAG